ncbi:Hypothetical predicted protein [Octopus vulgaris]|uniref:Laminin G domain-containing protein n=1 Tax=Octopus vulgaris TaxID=6645 RepID=A0AA36BGB8_OCTVU|nr:Hypothetical predicted protein [Octopus vulgaris]
MYCGTVLFFAVKCLLLFMLFSSIDVNGFISGSKKRAAKKRLVDYQISGYINLSSEIPGTPDVPVEEIMLQTNGIFKNDTKITKDLVTKNASHKSDSHIPDDCDPFINEYSCLSIIQKDDIYIKIIDTDSKNRGERQPYKRIEKYTRKAKRKRKKYRKRKQNKDRNKNDNKNNQKGSSSVNDTSRRKQCQTGAATIEVKNEKCTGSADLNPPSNLETKLPRKYWTVPKFVLALREKLIGKIKQLYNILRNGVGETIRKILHSYMQIHKRYKDIKEQSRKVLTDGHDVVIEIIQVSEQVYGTISSMNELTRRLYSRKDNRILHRHLRVSHHFAVIKSRNRHTHAWETLKALDKIKTIKNKVVFLSQFTRVYDYTDFYEKVYLLKEHTFNQRTRLIDLLDISRQVNYTLMYYPRMAKLENTRDISIMNRDLMDEQYSVKSRIRRINKNINNIRVLHTSCRLKLHHLLEIDFAAVIKTHVAKRKPFTEAEKRQVRKWASEVKEHMSDIDDVMEVIHWVLQPSLNMGKTTIGRLNPEEQNDDNTDHLERLRKKVHYWKYLKRYRSSKQRTVQKDGITGDDGSGSNGRSGDGHGSKRNRWRKKKRNFFKKIRSRHRRDVANADQSMSIYDTFDEIELKLREIIKKLDEVWANILRFINAKKYCRNGEDAIEGSGDGETICDLDGSTDDSDGLITNNKNVDENGFEFVDGNEIIPLNTKRLLEAYMDEASIKSKKVQKRCYNVQQDIQDLKPKLAQVSSELSRTEKLANSTTFLQTHIFEFLSNRTKYIAAELKETTAELELILNKIETLNNLAEKVLADEDNLRKLLEKRKKEKEKRMEKDKKKAKNMTGKKKKPKGKKNDKQRDRSEASGGKRKSKVNTTEEDEDEYDEDGDDDGGVDVVPPIRNKKRKKERDEIKTESESDVSLGDGKNLGSKGNRKKADKHSGRNGNSVIVNRQDKKVNGQRKRGKSDVSEKEDEIEGENRKGKKRKKESKGKSDVKKKVEVEEKNEKVKKKKPHEKDEKENDKIGGSKDNKEENWLDVWEDLVNFENMVRKNESLKLVSEETSSKKSNKAELERKTTKDENNDREEVLVLKKDDWSNKKKNGNEKNEGKDTKSKKRKSKRRKDMNKTESKEKGGSSNTKKENWLDLWENLIESQELLKKGGSEDLNRNEESQFQNEQNVAERKDGYYEKQQEKEGGKEIKDFEKENSKNVGNIVNIKKQKHYKILTKEDQESRKNKLKLKIKKLQRYRRDLRSTDKNRRSFDRKRDARRRRRMRKKRRRNPRRRDRTHARLQSDKAEDEDAVVKFVTKLNKQIEIDVAKSKENIVIMNKTLQELPKDLHQSVISNVEQLRMNISQIQYKIHLARTLLSAMKIPVKFTGKDYLKVPLHPGYDSRKIQSDMDVCVKPKLKSGAILAVNINNSVSYILGLKNSAVFLSVYDMDGKELKVVESKSKTKPEVWYKFGIQSVTISPISAAAQTNKEVVKIFLPKINAEYTAPSVAYVGGYPEELWKNKLKQLEGCVGSLDVDGHAMSLMQPFSDGSQPTPCTHGCGDNSSMVFEGNGFAEFHIDDILKTGLTSVQLSFKTYQTDALLLFLKNTNFQLIVTLESGNILIQYELEDTQTAKLSGPKELSNGMLHKIQISIKNGKFSAGIVGEKFKFDNTDYKPEKNELETVFSLGGLSPHYQNNTISYYRSLTGCLSNVWLNDQEVSLLHLQDASHVQLGNCDKNLWLSCIQFTKHSKAFQLPDFGFVKSISIKVSHQANGVALFFEREEKFAIEVNLQDSLVEVTNHVTKDKSSMTRNSSTALWNVISVIDQVGNLHISLDGQNSVDMGYKKNTGWIRNNVNDFSMSITIGGLSEDYQESSKKSKTLHGSISSVLIENALLDLRRLGISNQIDVCSKPIGA